MRILRSMDGWRTVLQGIQAASALAVACLAIYGLFFTSIPETLIRQFRSDIADAKEELVGLRSERNRLTDQLYKLQQNQDSLSQAKIEIEKSLATTKMEYDQASAALTEARTDVTSANSEVTRLRSEIATLKLSESAARVELDKITTQITALSAERSKYLKSARSGEFLFAAVRIQTSEIEPYTKALGAAKTYVDLPKWLSMIQEADRTRRTQSRSVREISYEDWVGGSTGDKDEDSRRLSFFIHAGVYNINSSLGPINTDAMELEARRQFENSTPKVKQTGVDLVRNNIPQPQRLTPKDADEYRRLAEVTMRQIPALSQTLMVDKDKIFSRGDIGRGEIIRTEAAIAAVKAFVDAFFKRLEQ